MDTLTTRSIRFVAALIAGAGLAAAPAGSKAGEKLALARDGLPAATIVVPQSAGLSPLYAAGELRDHVRKITGAELPIVTEAVSTRFAGSDASMTRRPPPRSAT